MKPVDEVAEAVRGEVARCVGRATEHAEDLESAGALLLDLLGEVHGRATPEELARCSNGIRAFVAHAFAILADLQHASGRLDALAAVRAAAASDNEA